MNARIQKHSVLTTEPPSGEMQIGRMVLLTGLVGSFLANVASQLMGTHLGVQTGIHLSSTDVSCISAAYTMASFVGMVVAQPLEKALGMRRYFVASALLFAAFGWLQATRPSLSVLIAMRVFEGFITGGFGPRALLATFMLYRGERLPVALALSAFLLLVSCAIGLVLLGASESLLGWRGVFFVQFGLSSILVLAALRWLPRTVPRVEVPVANNNFTAPDRFVMSQRKSSIRRRPRSHRVGSPMYLPTAAVSPCASGLNATLNR